MNVTPLETALEKLFGQAVIENLPQEDSARYAVTALPANPARENSEERTLVVLNIASYLFRLVVLFEFKANAVAVEQLAQATRSPGRLEGQAWRDACSEFANMLCGAVNRRLCQQFRHVGMSTPFILESTCSQYIAMLKPSLTQVLNVTVEGKEWLRLNVCLCAADKVVLHFPVLEMKQDMAACGELELF